MFLLINQSINQSRGFAWFREGVGGYLQMWCGMVGEEDANYDLFFKYLNSSSRAY